MFRPFVRLYPVFLVVALISALYGFGTASSGAGDWAKVLYCCLPRPRRAVLAGWMAP
jgi:uncharacterized membrane protein YtjA (UPF0391 family)